MVYVNPVRSKIRADIQDRLKQALLVSGLAFLFLLAHAGSVAVSEQTAGAAFAQTVGTDDLADRAVTGPKIAPKSVGKNKIKDGAVISDKILDGAVTFDKIKDGAVTSAKIKDGTIRLRDLDPSIPTKGDRGEVGPQGPAGPQGPQGAAGAEGGDDSADGVQITFARKLDFDPGSGSVPSLDLNGTNLYIPGATPGVTLGGAPLAVMLQGAIPNSTHQQVIVRLPDGLLPGNYRVVLKNSQGSSSFEAVLGTPAGGGDSIPSGAVMHFNLTKCPQNWTALASAQGRYLVGIPSGGTVGQAVGTALGNGENRAVGRHGHSGSVGGSGNHTHKGNTSHGGSHSHDIDALTGLTNLDADGWHDSFERGPHRWFPNFIRAAGNHSHNVSLGGGSHTHSVTVNNAGSVAGTNAPYLQLLVCQKN